MKKKDSGEIFAMKIIRKETVYQKGQIRNTRAEKSILERIQHPFIVKLHYAFQSQTKLYMVELILNMTLYLFFLKISF